ncbi:MAG: hypothetical protein OIF50_17675 [Flavobacteriaceae bacterium]|nr:hypothetical protein [Flavobacteriaceae bacterium]
MTIQKILEQGKYHDQTELGISEFTVDLEIPIFSKKVRIKAFNLNHLSPENDQVKLLEKSISTIINYDLSNLNWIKDEIWKHFNSYMNSTSYEMIDYSSFDNEEEANRAYFKISNQNDAYNKCELKFIHFDLDQTNYEHFILYFKCPWEEEHGISICIHNGKLDYID